MRFGKKCKAKIFILLVGWFFLFFSSKVLAQIQVDFGLNQGLCCVEDNCTDDWEGECTIPCGPEKEKGDCCGGWFQTKDMDVFSSGKISSAIPSVAPTPYFSVDGLGGFPGVVVYNSTTEPNFGEGEVAEEPSERWIVNSTYKGKKIDFQYLVNRLRIDKEAAKANGFPASTPESKIYYAEGGQTVTGEKWAINDKTKATVFVDGDLNIQEDIEVDSGGFLAVIVSGDIRIEPEVEEVQGFFVADKKIIVESKFPDTDDQFKGEGSFIAWQGFQLNRALAPPQNETKPAEIFSSRPDLWLNFPSEFTYSLTYREELLP